MLNQTQRVTLQVTSIDASIHPQRGVVLCKSDQIANRKAPVVQINYDSDAGEWLASGDEIAQKWCSTRREALLYAFQCEYDIIIEVE